MSRLGEAYIRQLLPAAQYAMLRGDDRTLQGLINASTINPEVKALAFYSSDGQLLAYRGGKHSLSKPFTAPKFTGITLKVNKLIPLLSTLSPLSQFQNLICIPTLLLKIF